MPDSKHVNTQMPIEEAKKVDDAKTRCQALATYDNIGDQGTPSLTGTVSDHDAESDPAEEIEQKGEPFEGNHA